MKEGWVLWFTGLHGAGKSTIAGRLAKILRRKHILFILLDGDELRKTISSDLGYGIKDRNEHMKRVADLCRENTKNGLMVIASVASPTEKSRKYARKVLNKMLLVYVKCPPETAERRDIKGHYKKALKKEHGFEDFLHGSYNFEEPENPDVVLDTDTETAEESAGKLMKELKRRKIVS